MSWRLPQYHIPQPKTVLMHVWERLKAFLKKAGTVLFIATLVMWFLSSFGMEGGRFGLVDDPNSSVLAAVGGAIAVIFRPLGFGEWQPVAASISGFTAKESIVSTMGVLAHVASDASEDTAVVGQAIASWFPSAAAAFSFLLFNLLDSPCLAAIGTMAAEMNDRKWFWFAILYQNVFAYVASLIVYQALDPACEWVHGMDSGCGCPFDHHAVSALQTRSIQEYKDIQQKIRIGSSIIPAYSQSALYSPGRSHSRPLPDFLSL